MTIIYHIGAHGAGNAGDIVILDSLRRLFPDAEWINRPDHLPFDEAAVKDANRADLVVVGGGGLFLRDTHANDVSGWRWNCSVEMMQKIETPIAVFGVGYNRFRNQDDFIPAFYENVAALVEKSVFFGMREKAGGELLGLSGVEYQPCPAMFCGLLFDVERKLKNRVVFAPAMDRREMRYKNEQATFRNIAMVLAALEAEGYQIVIVSHCGSDRHAAGYLPNYPNYDLAGKSTQEILNFYAGANLVLGMRLHSLMIPFGLGVPIRGIASHDKITRFFDDICHPEWCFDVDDDYFAGALLSAYDELDTLCTIDKIMQARNDAWELLKINLERINHETENARELSRV